MSGLTTEQIQALADQWLREALNEAESDRVNADKPTTIEQLDSQDEALRGLEREAREQLATNDYGRIGREVDIFLRDNPDVDVAKDSSDYRSLSREVLKRFVEFCRIEQDRNRGDYSKEISKGTVSTAVASPTPQRQKEELFSLEEAAEKYFHDKTNGPKPWSIASQKDIPPQVRDFITLVGKSKLIGDLSRDDMRVYWEAMMKLPSRRNSKPYKGKSLKQILRMNVPESERLKPKTLDTRFTNIRTFLNWAELEGCIDRAKPLNAILVAPDPEPTAPKRTAFNAEELGRLFSPSTYGHGRLFSKPWHYWIPLLALFTGARAEELAQLHTSDIKQIDDVWVLDINEIGDKRVKTKAGKRRVPVHPFLLDELNFLGFVAWSKKRKGDQLFKELDIRKSSGNRSGAVSQWFTRYRRRCGVGALEGVSDLTFHSFRHTVITWCKHHDIDRTKYKEVVGHEQGETRDVTSNYEAEYPAKMMLDDVIAPLDFHSAIPLDYLKESRWARW